MTQYWKSDVSATAASACLALFLGHVEPVLAQDIAGTALNGSKTLSTGFLPDPFVIGIEPGGETDVTHLGAECKGYIYGAAPDFELVLDTATSMIGIFVAASMDTTLVINDPSGDWLCNDDSAEAGGANPGIAIQNPEQGTYDIWVGTYEKGASGTKGNLLITEYAATQWAGLTIGGDNNASTADSSGDTQDYVSPVASAEETRCLDEANELIASLDAFTSTVYQAEREFVCDEDDVCKAGTPSSGYYYALGEACDVLLGPFERARQACLNFPDMDNIVYPSICR